MVDTRIPPHGIIKESRTLEYNPYIDSNVSLKSKALEDIKFIWKPEKIIFSDGSELD